MSKLEKRRRKNAAHLHFPKIMILKKNPLAFLLLFSLVLIFSGAKIMFAFFPENFVFSQKWEMGYEYQIEGRQLSKYTPHLNNF